MTDQERGETICQDCGKPDGTKELHVCPYQSEINDIDEPICNCCGDCTDQCAGQI